MIIAVDAAYGDQFAFVAGVVFDKWDDDRPGDIVTRSVSGFDKYVPGEFYRRELTGILELLKDHRIRPDCIVVDGYVYLDGLSKAGLGKHLYDALEGKVSVIGVAKAEFKGIPDDFMIYRGRSRKPLYVTSAGVEAEQAKRWVMAMKGPYRRPKLLRLVDQVCRRLAVEGQTIIRSEWRCPPDECLLQ